MPSSAPDTTRAGQRQGPSFLNNITINTKGGARLSGAYLTDENGSLLPPQNTLNAGDTVYLHLQVAEGWITQNGRIRIGAEQSIKTSKGEPVLNARDLLSHLPGMPEKEGARLLLPAVIARTRRGIDYFIVQFRVWDQKGPGEISGSYRLSVKEVE